MMSVKFRTTREAGLYSGVPTNSRLLHHHLHCTISTANQTTSTMTILHHHFSPSPPLPKPSSPPSHQSSFDLIHSLIQQADEICANLVHQSPFDLGVFVADGEGKFDEEEISDHRSVTPSIPSIVSSYFYNRASLASINSDAGPAMTEAEEVEKKLDAAAFVVVRNCPPHHLQACMLGLRRERRISPSASVVVAAISVTVGANLAVAAPVEKTSSMAAARVLTHELQMFTHAQIGSRLT